MIYVKMISKLYTIRIISNKLWDLSLYFGDLEGRKKILRVFKKMLFSWEGLPNAEKRQQIAIAIISICLPFSKSRALQGPKAFFADLQGPICYQDPQNKEINLIVY